MPLNPTHIRSVDPWFENRYTSPINRFTRLVSMGEDVILSFGSESFAFELQNYHTLEIGGGVCVKDDALIHITETVQLDFSEQDNYLGTPGLTSAGKYVIVLSYQYSRSIPAPKASYFIIKDRSLFYDNEGLFIFLGIANVAYDSGDGRFEITSVSYEDDSVDPFTRRKYPVFLPTLVDGGPIIP